MASMRTGEVIIEAVPKAKHRQGLLFLASGRADDAIAEAREVPHADRIVAETCYDVPGAAHGWLADPVVMRQW